jgi:hypothetical protein
MNSAALLGPRRINFLLSTRPSKFVQHGPPAPISHIPYLERVSLSSQQTFSPVAPSSVHCSLSFPEHLHPSYIPHSLLLLSRRISHSNTNPTSLSTVNMKFTTIILSTFLTALSVSAQNSTATPTSSVVSGTAPLTPAQSTEAACLEACEFWNRHRHPEHLLIVFRFRPRRRQ